MDEYEGRNRKALLRDNSNSEILGSRLVYCGKNEKFARQRRVFARFCETFEKPLTLLVSQFSDFFIKETILEKRSQLGKFPQKLLEQPEKVNLKFYRFHHPLFERSEESGL